MLKEELARTHGVAQVTSALQKEAVERAAALAAVKADVVEVDKAVGQARLESANEVANVRVSIMQLESSGEATRHEAESERRKQSGCRLCMPRLNGEGRAWRCASSPRAGFLIRWQRG